MRIHIIYLAAGNSRRFGTQNKLLYEYEGKPLVLHGLDMLVSLDRAGELPHSEHRTEDSDTHKNEKDIRDLAEKRKDITITVVTQYDEVAQLASDRGIPAVLEPECRNGVSYSIRAGIRGLDDVSEEDYLIFVVADQPHLTRETMERLLALTDTHPESASVICGGQPGNPTMFSARLIPELQALTGDKGGRAVIRRHTCTWLEVTDPRELEDIDVLPVSDSSITHGN